MNPPPISLISNNWTEKILLINNTWNKITSLMAQLKAPLTSSSDAFVLKLWVSQVSQTGITTTCWTNWALNRLAQGQITPSNEPTMDNLVLVGGGLLLLTDKLQQIQNPYSLTTRRFAARAHFSLLQDSRLHAFVWQTKECIQPTIVRNSQHPHWLSKSCEAPELGPFSPLGNESFKHVELQGQSICVHVLLKAYISWED